MISSLYIMQLLALHLHLSWLRDRHLLISPGAMAALDVWLAVVLLFVICGLMMSFLLEVAVVVIEVILESPEVEIGKCPPYEDRQA